MWESVHWLGHASFRIDGAQVIYIDPWKVKEAKPADLILVTHAHFDHFSTEDIARISGPNTVVVCPAACAEALSGDVRVIAPGESLQVGDVLIEAVPSYNTDKAYHPRADANVGYIVEVVGDVAHTRGRRIYHAGDTDLIPEMSEVRCDVALLPVGGTYTMNADQAAQAAARIRPKAVVPMHWGGIVGSDEDVQRFRNNVPEGIEVVILEPE